MLLGIDTSGAVSVAVARGDLPGPGGTDDTGGPTAGPEILAVRVDARSRHHDEVLLELIDTVVAEAGATRGDLTGVIAGRGPGPFTGLRVGLVTARSIAAVLDIPVRGVCSLDALAHQALAEDSAAGPRTVAVALDARRREIYHARYRCTGDGTVIREDGPAVAAPSTVAEQLAGCDLLVGSGTGIYPELLPATSTLVHADAGHLIAVAAQQTARGEDLTSTDPLYLRDPDAARPTARKSTLGLP